MAVIGWKVFCALFVALSVWLGSRTAHNVWKWLKSGSICYVDIDPMVPRVSRRANPTGFWLLTAFNLMFLAFYIATALLFALAGIGILPTMGLPAD